MLSLEQSARAKGAAGEPLPKVWDSLWNKGTQFIRGQLCLVAAGPGTGKSGFVLSYALQSGVTCLYISADSDAFIQLSRSLAILGDLTLDEAKEMVHRDDTEQIIAITKGSPIRFSYEASPTLDHIERQMLAYEELYGDFPELVVIDNVLDVVLDYEEDSASRDSLMAWLHELARNTGACVVALHHVTGPFNDSDKPIPLSGVKGQIGRVPEVVLTLHKEVYEGMTDTLHVSTVKNRGNKADASGNSFVSLDFNGDKMLIRDPIKVGEGWAERM